MATRHPQTLTIFFMALFMSFIMSGVITLFNAGYSDIFLTTWMKAWGFAFVVALPTIFVVSPLVRRLVLQIAQWEDRLIR